MKTASAAAAAAATAAFSPPPLPVSLANRHEQYFTVNAVEVDHYLQKVGVIYTTVELGLLAGKMVKTGHFCNLINIYLSYFGGCSSGGRAN